MKKRSDREDQIRAEAAVWIARLQATEDRDPEVVQGLQQWLSEDVQHREIFDRATWLWEMVAGAEAMRTASSPRLRSPRWRRPMIAVFASLLVAAFVVLGKPYLLPDRFETGVGEQRIVQLSDGSEIVLNTDSLIEVRYGWHRREMRLVRGEALFRIAHEPERPLRVHHRQGSVDVLGTVFLIYDEPARSSVTLIEGRVAVQERNRKRGEQGKKVILNPGERLITDQVRGAVIDHPSITAVTAWQKRQLMFDDVSLQDAVYEINRYQPQYKIQIEPNIAGLRLSGVFSSHDPRGFSAAIAALHDLRLKEESKDIYLHRRTKK